MKGDLHLSGVGMKAPDWMTVPLCRECHGRFHQTPGRMQNWRLEQREWMLRTLMRATEDKMLIRYIEFPDTE